MPLHMPAVTLAVTAVLIAGAGTAGAQTQAAPEQTSLATAATAAAQTTELQPPPAKKRKNPVAIGTLIGAGGAAALTAVAAAQYGANEGGRFCIPCLAQWGMITIPVGAGIGAGVGWIVKASSSGTQPPGLPPPPVTAGTPSGPRRQVAVGVTF